MSPSRAALRPRPGPTAVLLGLVACAGAPSRDAAPEPEAPSAAPATAGPQAPPILVRLAPPRPTGEFRWETEVAGLVTLLAEEGLSELEGVLVEAEGHPRPPGTHLLLGEPEPWTATLRLGSDPTALDLELDLCAPGGLRCTATSATGTREAPQLALTVLLRFASGVLAREPGAGTVGQAALPVSQDSYAQLICGRSAAVWYGLLPPVPPEQEGQTRDSIHRAVLIDPSMAAAQWLLGRRHAEAGRWDDALQAFTAAREGRPFQPVFLANQAEALAQEGKLAAAADAWDGLVELAPKDPRFRLARVRALLAARRLDDARAALEGLFADWPTDPGVAEARVALADAAGEVQGTDDLLAHWAETDRGAVEPVRRRVQLRVRDGRYQEGWEMLAELRRREAHVLADGFQVPLGVALGRWAEAAEAAQRVGRTDVAARIRARRDLEADPANPVDGLLDWDPSPEAHVAMGRSALLGGRPEHALERAGEASEEAPWDPRVLSLQAETWAATGQQAQALAARQRLAAVEPPSPLLGPERTSLQALP